MITGDKSIFAIEFYTDSGFNPSPHVFGRMCIWIDGKFLGDISEPDCILEVSRANLEKFLKKLKTQKNGEFPELSDLEAFEFLHQKLYEDDERTDEEIREDGEKYWRYDFLTNGGESFDPYASFAVTEEESIRFLWQNWNTKEFYSAVASKEVVLKVISEWLSLIEKEKITMSAGKRAPRVAAERR
jgi:hypothetical protein